MKGFGLKVSDTLGFQTISSLWCLTRHNQLGGWHVGAVGKKDCLHSIGHAAMLFKRLSEAAGANLKFYEQVVGIRV